MARGANPWARVPLGYVRRDDGTLEPNRDEIPIVRKAFEMRAAGASHTQIREMLKSRGISRSHRGVQVMLSSRVVLGEVHFGSLVNLHAHEPILDRELWQRVQRMTIPRGRKPSSDRLLATGFAPKKTVTEAIGDVVEAYRDGRIKDDPAAYNVTWMKQHNFA